MENKCSFKDKEKAVIMCDPKPFEVNEGKDSKGCRHSEVFIGRCKTQKDYRAQNS